VAAAVLAAALGAMAAPARADCAGRVYLTLDTGNMAHAEAIAQTLVRHQVRATFFLANERTPRGDYALDASWATYWKARVIEGHAFGTHTWRHGRLLADEANGTVRYRPQFGTDVRRTLALSGDQFCAELRSVDTVFEQLTGRRLDALWRAPGGRTTPNAMRAAQRCGYAHVHWAPAGFLGDELSSDKYPNELLLRNALRDIRSGDVLIAHLGIWSRKEPFAPMLDPLIAGLKQRGFCFERLTEHPEYSVQAPLSLAASARSPKP
jgi:peptidoglycan/xylan/chitin deacetylase (PgdA/CDA1 family)